MSRRSAHVGRVAEFLRERDPVEDPEALARELDRQRLVRRATAQRFQRRSRLRAAWAPATLLSALLVLVVAGAWLLASGKDGLPGSARALAAAIERNRAVLHTVSTGPGLPSVVQGRPRVTRVERWVAAAWDTVRTRTTFADGSVEDMLSERRGGRYRISVYRSRDRTLTIAPWLPFRGPETPPDQLGVENLAEFARAVRDGRAEVVGRTTVDGVAAVRIKLTRGSNDDRRIWTITEDADPARLLRIDEPCQGGTCPSERFSVYETLPDRRALRLPRPPDTRIVRPRVP